MTINTSETGTGESRNSLSRREVRAAVRTAFPGFVLIRRAELDRLRASAEDAADVAAFDATKAEAAGQPFIPADVAFAIAAGIHPLKAWRKARGLTLVQLSRQAEASKSQLSMIETRQREPSLALLKRLAAALGANVGDLVEDRAG